MLPSISRTRCLRLLKRLGIVLVIVAILLEGFFRYVLFGDDPLARRLGTAMPRLRKPQAYAFTETQQYWTLQYRLNAGSGREASYDPLLGWKNRRTESETYRFLEEEDRGDRRPVLFFGDSFANCLTADEDCWQGLLARSELGERFTLLNYGTGGYGLGQISVLCRLALPNYLDQKPLVVVSLLVDDDLDRAVLGFRSWPKPRFFVDDEGHAQSVEGPVPTSRQAYLDSEGIGISSYAMRYLVFGTRLGWLLFPDWKQSYRDDHNQTVRVLTRALLEELVDHLQSTELEFTFLLFHGKGFLGKNPRHGWRDELVIGELERLNVPYLLSREALAEDSGRSGRRANDYFIPRGQKGASHYNALGNEVVFRLLQGWIAGASR